MEAAVVLHEPLSRVLIVDDHPFFSCGLAQVLRAEGLARHVDCRDSVRNALLHLGAHPGTDLILLDLALPGEGGLALFSGLEDAGLPIPVVVISSREDETSLRAAKAAGALGFLPKSSDRPILRRMIERIRLGDSFFPRDHAPSLAGQGRLTPRQRDVLRLLAAGLPNKRICTELGLTEHTVKSHLKALFSHFNAHNRTECVIIARELGVID